MVWVLAWRDAAPLTLEHSVRRALGRSRGVALVGPRQAGKSTLAQQFVSRDSPNYFDLEYPLHAQRLAQPVQVLERLQGLVVIDEVQRQPELFPLLRVLMDRSDAPGQYLLLGSASPSLARQAGLDVAAPAMLRFWTMLARYHGQIWSAADPARSLAVSQPTIRRYLDILTQTMMVRQLQPWHENLRKRQVKAPKIYFRDTGLLHALMGVESMAQLLTHPRAGAMRIAMDDLKLDVLYVVHPGLHRFALSEGIEAVPLWSMLGG